MPQRDLQRRAQRAAWWSQAAASRLPLLRFLTRGPLLSGGLPQSPFAPPGGPVARRPAPCRPARTLPASSRPLTLHVRCGGARRARRRAAGSQDGRLPPDGGIAARRGVSWEQRLCDGAGRGHDPGAWRRVAGVCRQDGAPGGGGESARVDDGAGRRGAGPSVSAPCRQTWCRECLRRRPPSAESAAPPPRPSAPPATPPAVGPAPPVRPRHRQSASRASAGSARWPPGAPPLRP